MKQLFWTILLFTLISKGGNCVEHGIEEIKIKQDITNVSVEGKPQYEVTIYSLSPCKQSDVNLTCSGFQSTKKLNPLTLVKSGGGCLLYNGSVFPPFSGTKFTYAWDSPYPFKTISSKVDCS